jgi:uncharacterized secreted repeat protein (TIGR03808 family)
MAINRRRALAISAATGALPGAMAIPTPAAAVPMSSFGIDATTLGVRAGGTEDQTGALQRAIDRTAGARVPLLLGPGIYRTGELKLPSGAHILGIRGATRLVFTSGSALISARGADHLTLAGLVLDGGGRPLPESRGLLHLAWGGNMRIVDCEVAESTCHGIVLEAIAGSVTGTTVRAVADTAILSLDARGLAISGNVVQGAGNNGIQVWRTKKGEDGTLVVDNRIEDVAARSGGSGQNGNAVNVFRAANVIVRGNAITRAAFSAVRGNAASNIQILGNSCSALGEVAIYSEFGFEGAVIANNTVDGAALGVSVTNFNEGGRLAVVQGNLVRNLKPKRPAGTDPNDGAGIGISVEADASVTGNVVEHAPTAGIMIGWGQYMRDVSVTGNVVRSAALGIAVSVTPGAGTAVISGNLIANATRGAIVGMDLTRTVTGDLVKDGARYAQLSISGNRVR